MKLVSRRAPGDPAIDFTAFVEQRSAALFRTAYVLTGDVHVADDLVQEALIRVYRHWRRVCQAESPEAYVRRIVVNLASNHRRWKRGRPDAPLAESEGAADPRDRMREVDVREEVVQALHTLPVGMRTVVVLHYLHDLSDTQIAQDLGIAPSAVRSQLARGLAKLRAAAGTATAADDCAPSLAPRGGTR